MSAGFREASDLLRWCGWCAAVREFEPPDCAEDHGLDCPELVCVACGEAIVVSFVVSPSARAGIA